MQAPTRLIINWVTQELIIGEQPPNIRVEWTLRFPDTQIRGVGLMAFNLRNDQEVDVTISATDQYGNETTFDGPPLWTVSDPTILAFAATGDAMGGTLTPVGPVGLAQLQVSVDAAFGSEVRPITGVLDVQVMAGEAATITIIPGEPTDRPPA